jgi:predicted nucleic acid-binding protein
MAKSLYDKRNGDILDILVPFIVIIVNKDESGEGINKSRIQSSLKEDYNLKIPLYVLKSIITRAKRKKYLKQANNKMFLAENAAKIIDNIKKERKINRENQEFISGLKEFLKEKNINLSQVEIADKLKEVINTNLKTLTAYLGDFPDLNKVNKIKEKEARYFLKYFEIVEKEKPAQFEVLKNLIMGSVICALVKKDHNQLKSKLKPAKIFLDTNVIFNILAYHAEELVLPCQELIKILKENNFKFYIFDFTIQEVRTVLGRYSSLYHKTSREYRNNSIYSKLKAMGKTPLDIREVILNLEQILREKEIEVYPTEKELSNKIDPDLDYGSISQYKESSNFTHNHDLYAIEYIRKIRSKRVTKLENAKAIFLTSDLRLVKYNFCEDGHRNDSTLNEVIATFTLSNILWFKNPGINNQLPLKSAISIHANSLFLDNGFWNNFHHKLEQMKKDKLLTEEDLAYLGYSSSLKEILIELDENNQQLTDDLIIEIIEKSKIEYEKKEKEFCVGEKEKEKLEAENEELHKLVNHYNKNIQTDAAQNAARNAKILKVSVIVPLIILSIYSYFAFGSENIFLKGTGYLPGMLGLIGGLNKSIGQKIEDYLKDKEMEKANEQYFILKKRDQ